ncbi:BglG family transcription antiterminator [Desemzia sp. RIT804]|uniref:BglG family transcription antiterminator n=1 Tax=Desemzia sp. RIT 804 TaxID=2810209 RepID=UPI00194EBDD0|nr:BglG family transcription antiterminator [Desemzia sp. RIT 804]MBM6615341.1 BglG family transcription antiterminator [Desemzia sp. RIT 804]
MLTNESILFIRSLFENNNRDVSQLSGMFHISKKKFWQELEKINSEFRYLKIPEIKLDNGKIKVSDETIKTWNKESKTIQTRDLLLHDERIYLIILYTFIKREPISNNHYQEILKLSKNSVLLDLKKVRKLCKNYNIQLIYTRQNGYDFIGKEYDIRNLASYSIENLLSLTIGEWLLDYIQHQWKFVSHRERISQEVLEQSKDFGVTFAYDRLKEVIFFFDFLEKRKDTLGLILEEKDISYIENHPIYSMGEKVASMLAIESDKSENCYITIRLLGALQGSKEFYKDKKFEWLTAQIINRVQAIIGVQFQDRECLSNQLFEHLIPAYFRIKYDIRSNNPYTKQIKKEYNDLYYLVEKGLMPLEAEIGKPIPVDEVAYFTIHFGGNLSTQNNEIDSYKALSICPNGISSSLIMQTQLKGLFPNIKFSSIHSLPEAQKIDLNEYDMVFSTTYFETEKPVFLTKPFLNKVEKEILISQVKDSFNIETGIQHQEVTRIIEVIDEFAVIENKKELYNRISTILNKNDLEENNKGEKNLTDLLQKKFIQFTETELKWEDAISVAAQPLLEEEYISRNYITAMVDTVKKLGAYIVLAPHVAVPHARPEDGVKQLGISLLHSKKPIDFNLGQEEFDEDREVHLIFILAAIDSTGHLKALQQLTKILEEEENIEELIDTKNSEELYNKIKEIIQI